MKRQSLSQISKELASLLSAIASPERITLLLLIGKGEACVCHLEAASGWRQAYISQHLMTLRKAAILQGQRKGRYVFYRMRNTALLDLIISAAVLNGFAAESVTALINTKVYPSCDCPQCAPGLISIDELKPA